MSSCKRALSKAEIELLCNQYYHLIDACAKKYRRIFPDDQIEDIKSDGSIGLLEAITTFKPDKSSNLKKYIEIKIRHRIKDGLRKRDKFRNRNNKSQSSPVNFCSIEDVHQDVCECQDDNFTKLENKDLIESLLEGLSDSSRELIELHYIKGLSTEQIAKVKSTSIRNIQRQKNKIIERLKELVKKYE